MKKIQYNDNKNIISEKLKASRERAGLSQSQLAAKMQTFGINLDQQMISRIEKNLRQVTDYELAAFCDILGVEPADMLSGFHESK